MTHLLEDLTQFIIQSPTPWHATEEMGNRLALLDFEPLDLDEKWKLAKGRKYFVIRDGSIAAFSLPKEKPQTLACIAAHTDSPSLKLKPRPEIEKRNMQLLGVEIYGSPILLSWFNRDLAIAGRVILKKKNQSIEEALVFFEDAPVLIPLLAPHLDKEMYKKGFLVNPQEHLFSIASLKKEKSQTMQKYLENLLKREHSFQKLLDFDLFLLPLDPPRFIGEQGEMLSSYRLDNLSSVHAGLVALGNLEKPSRNTLSMGIFWNHEEVGSSTTVGASSPFFHDIFHRITNFYRITEEEQIILRHKSLCLSVDLAHAWNPNYEKAYDPEHAPLLGEGITIKYNANMRYASSGKTAALIAQKCSELNLNCQRFVNRSDRPTGSTIGPYFATQLGIPTVDIGIPELSMHAAREVIACQDHMDMCFLLTQFLQKGI